MMNHVTHLLRTILTTTAAALVLALPTAAQADPNPAKEACKDGGYVNYVDPSTRQSFTNQGTCVSFVHHGGTLVSADPVITLAPTFRPDWGIYEVAVEVQSTLTDQFITLELVTGDYTDSNRQVYLDSSGYGRTSIGVAAETELTVAYDGEIIARVTPLVAPVATPA